MRITQINRPTQLLVAANVVLLLIIAVQILYPAKPAAAESHALQDSAAILPEFGDVSLSPPGMADLADMLGRPLFFVDRKMPKPPETLAPAPPPTPLRLQLEGVAMTSGASVAVLRNLADNQLVQLAEGETHDGWTLDSVNSNSASFSRGAQVTELPLNPGTNGRRR